MLFVTSLLAHSIASYLSSDLVEYDFALLSMAIGLIYAHGHRAHVCTWHRPSQHSWTDQTLQPMTADEPAPPKQPSNRNRNHNHNDHSMPRPTHFLTFPISHHPELRNAISALTSSWLAHDPPIDGLDPSIVVQPRRLHLTLGVMALTPLPPPNRNSNDDSDSDGKRDLASDGAPCQRIRCRWGD